MICWAGAQKHFADNFVCCCCCWVLAVPNSRRFFSDIKQGRPFHLPDFVLVWSAGVDGVPYIRENKSVVGLDRTAMAALTSMLRILVGLLTVGQFVLVCAEPPLLFALLPFRRSNTAFAGVGSSLQSTASLLLRRTVMQTMTKSVYPALDLAIRCRSR